MNEIYPPESQKLDVVGHLEELRIRIIVCLAVILAATVVSFINGEYLLNLLYLPAKTQIKSLIFISPTEAFVSYLKISMTTGIIITFPVILFEVWAYVAPAIDALFRKRLLLWLVFSFLLFYLGVAFSYFIAIPRALVFLIEFGKSIATPSITISRYVAFFVTFVLIGGIIFQIPLVIAALSDMGIIQKKYLAGKRPVAVVAILIIAAIITPTQDIFNLLLFSIPMILLFEVGVFIAGIIERKKGFPKG